MDKKSKYSLFPAKPSLSPREPLPPVPEGTLPSQPDAQRSQGQESPTIPPQQLFFPTPKDRSPTPTRSVSTPYLQEQLAPPAPEEPSFPGPPLNNSWSSREEITSTVNGTSTPVEDGAADRQMHRTMHIQTPSTSSSSSESSLSKPMDLSTAAPSLNPRIRTRPRTVYFHSGIGGAGNYHKAIREDNVLRRMCRDRDRSTQPRFLSSLFGTLGGKKSRRQEGHYGGDESGSAQSSGETLSLGAAEVMRRKMLGFALDGKTKEKAGRGDD